MMPLAVYVLGLAIFAQGTSELMLAGLLPELAADLGVSIPTAGLLISAFALGMLVGAPVLAVLTLRWPKRTALLAFLAVFAVAHVVGALTSSYGVLFATRVVGAFVYAGFWAVGAASAVDLVAPDARGRAMSIVAGGLTVATLVGLPLGTLVGQHFGWRASFWLVTALAVLAMVGVFVTVPAGRPASSEPSRLAPRARALATGRLWLAYASTALATAALLVTFSYLAPLLTGPAGLPAAWVPAVLALYGGGALLGIGIGGRTADAHPVGTLLIGVGGLVVVSIALAVLAHVTAAVIVLVALLGAVGFGVNPALNSQVFALTEAAPTLVAALNVSSFNVGITVGPWLGGLALAAGAGYPFLGWLGAVLGVFALGAVVALSARRARTASAVAPGDPATVGCRS